MPKQIDWTFSVRVVEGSRVSDSATIEVKAVNDIGLDVDTGQTREVYIQPGGEGQVQFLLIKSKPPSDQVAYKVNNHQQTPERRLDGPHLLIGKGAARLLDLPLHIDRLVLS